MQSWAGDVVKPRLHYGQGRGRCLFSKRSLTPGRAAMLRSANYFDGSRPALTPPASPGMMLNPGAKPIIWSHRAGRRGREAEGGGLLNRYTGLNLYRGFESLRLR